MIELRKSCPEEIPECQELFCLCFGDGPAYSDQYFRYYYRPEEFLVLRDEGRLVCMGGVLKVCLSMPDGKTVRAAYLYALATHPDCRGKGYAGMLLRYADACLEKECDCLITVPAQLPLHAFFERAGFEACFDIREGWVLPGACTDVEEGRPVTADTYDGLRERLLEGTEHVSYGGLTGLQSRLCDLSDGALLAWKNGCAAVEVWDGTVFIKELLCPAGSEEGYLAAIAGQFSGQKYLLRLPCWYQTQLPLVRRAFGRIKWYGTAAVYRREETDRRYLGLAFD